MKALHAEPKSIRKIFDGYQYRIPDFQRPYSWDEEECEKLWEDILDFYYNRSEGGYFLGTLVLYKFNDQSSDHFYVVDGQQRLTSLQLLIKALFNKSSVSIALKRCMQMVDSQTEEYLPELRLQSEVIGTDLQGLEKIILNKPHEQIPKNFEENFQLFERKIHEFILATDSNPDKLRGLIETVLDHIVLLPIHCSSEDDALTLFDTINNRGLPLSDSDIFKSKLHKFSGSDKDEFVSRWAELKNQDWLFRTVMHLIRAKERNTTRESSLRSFFEKRKDFFSNWREVLTSLELSNAIDVNLKLSDRMDSLRLLMESYPNYYWKFPIYVFLHRYSNFSNLEISLDELKIKKLELLLESMVRYAIIKGVTWNSVNRIKDDIFKLCYLVYFDEDYISYLKEKSSEDFERCRDRIEKNEIFRNTRTLVLLGAFLNPSQNYITFRDFVTRTFHLEHILPKQWNNYDRWTQDSHKAWINSLGNLVPLEAKLNIAASDEFFTRKQAKYRDSKIQDALDLARNHSKWYPEDLELRDKKIKERIIGFLNPI